MTSTKTDKNQLSLHDGVLYAPRFLETHAGNKILHDPKTAIIELIANAWDAGARKVKITWPDGPGIKQFSIQDDGVGMTHEEFHHRWRTLNYNRRDEIGEFVVFPTSSHDHEAQRVAFGRNGVGRWSGFCFGESYDVDTKKKGFRNKYRVSRGSYQPFEIERLVTDAEADTHGTTISCSEPRQITLSAEEARAEIGMRFLTNPSFEVTVNHQTVSFEDIDDPNIQKQTLSVPGGESVDLIVIDTQLTDRSTRQHGLAWHVGGRLVGECSWKGVGLQDFIDGRRIAAKRFTFIVRADHLAEAKAIKPDWSGFDPDNQAFVDASSVVHESVREHMASVSEDDRKATVMKAREHNRDKLKEMGPLGRETWTKFVNEVQVKCPSIKESEVVKLSEIVANLEQSQSGYALLGTLSQYRPDQLDELHAMLERWTLDMAKAVLDEIEQRIKLVEELRHRTDDESSLEVQDLQPLFEKALWVFGPEFETIEYTSNQSMTTVVQHLFPHADGKGSRNRPDFVILPDGTAGLYSYPSFDEDGGEIGTERLVVVELKRPGVPIGSDEKAQSWKYVKELFEKGHLTKATKSIRCFVLGKTITNHEEEARWEKDRQVEIRPMLFANLLARADSRLLRLKERVKDAPFFKVHQQELEGFLAPIDGDGGLFDSHSDGDSAK